jgi:hypothetical protein
MQQSTGPRNDLQRKAVTEGAAVFVFLVVWLIPSASAVLEGYRSIVAAVVYGVTYGVLVNTLAIQLRLKNPPLIGVGVGLAFGLGTAAVANVFLSAAAQVAVTGHEGATIVSVFPAILLTFAIIPGLAGGVGMGFILGRMEVWRIFAVGGAAVVALSGMLGSWLYTPTVTWAAAGAGLCFGALSGFSVAVALCGATGARVAVLHYGVPVGLSGAIASALIMLDSHIHVAGEVASTAPWVLLVSAAAGAGGSATIYLGQYIGSELGRVGTLSLQDLASPLADIKSYIRPLVTFMSVYILIAIWFGLWYYTIDHFVVPHGFLIKRVYAEGSVDTFGYTSATEAVYYSFVTITTLGYGDIIPVRAWSKVVSIAEVIVGTSWLVVYFAFLFARLTILWRLRWLAKISF